MADERYSARELEALIRPKRDHAADVRAEAAADHKEREPSVRELLPTAKDLDRPALSPDEKLRAEVEKVRAGVPELQPQNWAGHSEEKIAVLQRAEDVMAKEQGRPAATVDFWPKASIDGRTERTDPGDFRNLQNGWCERDERGVATRIVINTELLNKADEAFWTLCHEGSHARDYDIMARPSAHSDVSDAERKLIQYGEKTYIFGAIEEADVKANLRNPLEVRANATAALKSSYLYGKSPDMV